MATDGLSHLKVAIVHDWFVSYAGSERVVEQMLQVFPQAELFAIADFLSPADRAFLSGRRVNTSFIQSLPGARKHYRSYLPLMPLAIEQLDVTGFDLVISSSHAVAKGVITGPDQLHISYVHSPIRYAWDLQHVYLRESGLTHGAKGWLARWILHKMRLWDARTASGVDIFIANSQYIARRILKAYRREAHVIYPPVDVEFFTPGSSKSEYYLAASRMVPYKRMPMIVDAFSRIPDKRLLVVGDGPEMDRVKQAARANVSVLGHKTSTELRDLLRSARALVFAAEEDFGIAPVEAQACGTPVIAYGKGGVTETIRPDTGLFFREQTPESLIAAVSEFESRCAEFSSAACVENAQRFSAEMFRDNLRSLVSETLSARTVPDFAR